MQWEQERHDLKRQLSAQQATTKYLQEELEALQEEILVKENNIEYLAKQLKEQKDLNKQSASEFKTKIENLEEQLQDERRKHTKSIDKLKEEFSLMKIEQDNQVSVFCSDQGILKNEKKSLEHNLEIIKNEYEQLLEEKMQIMKEKKEITGEREEMRNILLSKQEELATYMERCNVLQEEVVLLKIENDAFKSTPPSHSSKGNSVFAEVDDNRKALKSTLDKVAEKNRGLKRDLKCKSLEISKLRAEKSSLLKKVKEICSKFENNETNLIDNYKSRIKDLESIIEDSKRANKIRSDISEEEKAIDGLFAMKNKKIEDLEEKMEKLSQTVLLQNVSLYSLKKDLLIQSNQIAYELSEKMRLQEELNALKETIET